MLCCFGGRPKKNATSESDQPSRNARTSQKQAVFVDIDTDIVNYNQKQLALYDQANSQDGTKTSKTLDFFPPNSNDKPRTSQEKQRLEEYSQALYHTHDDFQNLARRSLTLRASHLPSHALNHRASIASSNHANRSHAPSDASATSDSLVLTHENLVGRFPSQAGSHARLSTPSTSSRNASQEQQQQQQQQNSQLLKDVALFSSADGAGYSSLKRSILEHVKIPRERNSFMSYDEEEDKEQEKEGRGSGFGSRGLGGRGGGGGGGSGSGGTGRGGGGGGGMIMAATSNAEASSKQLENRRREQYGSTYLDQEQKQKQQKQLDQVQKGTPFKNKHSINFGGLRERSGTGRR